MLHFLIRKARAHLPAMSKTEEEAIHAGDVSWEKELFCGRPQWKRFLSTPFPQLNVEEQAFLDREVEMLCCMLNDWEIVHEHHDLPSAVWEYLKTERFFGLVIPKEYGGRGFSALAHSTIVMKIATRSVSAAVNTMVPNSLGPAELLLHYGTLEQKNYYLPRLAKGEEVPCFALTGTDAGSDAASMTDIGIVSYGEYEGKKVLGMRLTWDKRYITLAPRATLLGLAFHLYDPNGLLGPVKDIGITLCLIPTSHPDVEIGHRHSPLYLAFLNGPTRGTDVFIPMQWVIGGPSMIGQGWKMLMEVLSVGRSISLPALSTAYGKVAYRLTGAYARLRQQFNTPIAYFEGVEEYLAEIAGFTYLLEASRLLTAGLVDQKIKPAIPSAIAKYHMTEMARTLVNHALDIHAGHAVQAGPKNILAHIYLAVPFGITVEGANILTRNLIIFGQGAIRCHPYILKEMTLLSAPDNADQLKQFDRLFISHIGYIICNTLRVIWQGITGGRFIFSPVRGPTSSFYRQLTRMSSALAWISDMCMLMLGGQLKRKERISARLGDILSQLYLASAVLKYFNYHSTTDDLEYTKWSITLCLYKIQHAFDELCYNFPIRWLGKIVWRLIFPWGSAYRKPSDDLSHRLVKNMLNFSDFRDRLTNYCFVGNKKEDPLYCIDQALQELEKINPIWKKFHNATRHEQKGSFEQRIKIAKEKEIITDEEACVLSEFNKMYQDIIRVNEFSFDFNSVII